jgi:hypothetical protein
MSILEFQSKLNDIRDDIIERQIDIFAKFKHLFSERSASTRR